tara:strand:+ start:362 stop:508 length:147 start_codon:yes stop_codon:yes gene_type:complete
MDALALGVVIAMIELMLFVRKGMGWVEWGALGCSSVDGERGASIFFLI